MSIKEQLAHKLEDLSMAELNQVAEYVAFLKFRSRLKPIPVIDEAQLSALYAESAEEDRKLAEEGIASYVEGLVKEDAQ